MRVRTRLHGLCARCCYLFILCSLAHSGAMAQRQVEFNDSYPAPPQGLADNPLPDGPFTYRTAEGMDIKVEVLARLVYPSSMAFLPDGRILVSTREAHLRLIDNGELQPEPVNGGPGGFFRGEAADPGSSHGYMDVVLHPDFEDNAYIYLSYTRLLEDDSTSLAFGRGRWDGSAIVGFEELWTDPAARGPGRITFDHDGKLYITTSGEGPQDLSTPGGSVLRFNDDGTVPEDNPFVGREGAYEAIYTYGHRNGLGIAAHPQSGRVWMSENGPNGGDEINILIPGTNYGWPEVSLGRTYQGPWQSEIPSHTGYEAPVIYWMPAIAVTGLVFYDGDALPAWKGDIFVGALRTGEIPGTGHIERILINEDFEELRRESLLTDLRQRVRDIQQGPDDLLYVATDQREGAILRISPAE